MVENTNTSVMDMPYFPATVCGSSNKRDGQVLHTIGDDHETDIRTYESDDKDAHRVGNQ